MPTGQPHGAGLGTLLIVPAAGVTHAASGSARPSSTHPMLVIAGGVRRDTGRAYQLHDMDQHALLKPSRRVPGASRNTPTWCQRCTRPGASR